MDEEEHRLKLLCDGSSMWIKPVLNVVHSELLIFLLDSLNPMVHNRILRKRRHDDDEKGIEML